MNPRNLTLFRFSIGVALDLSMSLASALPERALRSPGPQELFTAGFVPPLRDDRFVCAIPGRLAFRFGVEERLLPNASINVEVAKKVRQITDAENRKVGGRERKRLREDTISQMLPNAPVRVSYTDGYVDTDNGYLVLDTASRRRAERVLTCLREALGSFPAVPLAPEEGPRVLMTDWLAKHHTPDGFGFGDECELRDPGSNTGAIARFRRQDLEAEEVRENLRNGKLAYRLGLTFDDRLSLVLGEDLVVRKLKMLDVVLDDLDAQFETAASEYEARFALAAGEIGRLIAKLQDTFTLPRPVDA